MKIEELIKSLSLIKQEDVDELKGLVLGAGQVIMLGNGGSNSICSHISQDYTKQLKKRSFTFSDPSRLTCYVNDYGAENAYSQFLREFYTDDTLVVLISSSGNSQNILNCAKMCVKNNVQFIILSGFNKTNELRKKYSKHALMDVWVSSKDYGVVETVHKAFLHAIV